MIKQILRGMIKKIIPKLNVAMITNYMMNRRTAMKIEKISLFLIFFLCFSIIISSGKIFVS